MTNPTAREVIGDFLSTIAGPVAANEGPRLADQLIESLDRAGKEIVDKGAVAKEREACALVAWNQRTAAERDRKNKSKFRLSALDPETQMEIQSEECGERIASEQIAAAIRARGKE